MRFATLSATLLVALASSTAGYTVPQPPKANMHTQSSTVPTTKAPHATATAAAAASVALSFLLLNTEPAMATSSQAAQITLNSIPPTSVEVNIRDLPLIGDVLSGTYTKVSTPVKNPSVTIASPKDKVGAIKAAATNGHLEFDVNGKLGTHLDIDITADQAGVAQVRVASPLIPQLPFKNPAANAPKMSSSKETSEWFVVTNMGSGESYYYNDQTGDTTFKKPKGF